MVQARTINQDIKNQNLIKKDDSLSDVMKAAYQYCAEKKIAEANVQYVASIFTSYWLVLSGKSS